MTIRGILHFAIALIVAPAFAETVLFDAAKAQPAVSVWKGAEFGQSAEYRADGLLVCWNAAQNNICIFSIPAKLSPTLGKFDEAVCRVRLELAKDSPVRSFSVRFTDARNEVFQWRVPVDIKVAGPLELRIPMTPKNFFVSFGAEKDGIVDFPIRFFSCTASSVRGSGEASLTLKSITCESTLESELTGVGFDLETGNAPRVLRPGEENKLEFRLRNPGDKELVCDAKVVFRNLSGRTVSGKTNRIAIPERGEFRFRPDILPPAPGIWYATCRLESPDRSRYAEHVRSFAYMTPAGPAPERNDGFIFGVCVPGINNPEVFAAEAETAALCGATALRINFRWRDIERKQGVWDFSIQDRILDEYAKYQIELMPILSNPPVWARSEGPNSTPDFVAWCDYTGRLFDRYGKQIRYWEIWNEPDLRSFAEFDAPDYVRLLAIAREEQRKRIPGSCLLTGGFASMYDRGKAGFQEYVLEHAHGNYDIHAFHGHGSYRSYVDQIENKLLPLRRRLDVTAPWYANETAVSALGIGEAGQAETLFKKFLYSWSAGAVGYNWYNLRNNGFETNNPEHNYGLVTCDFYPKAAYVAYNTLATLFRGKRFVASLAAPAGIRLLEFAGEKDRAVAAWNETPGETADESAVFRSDAATVEAVGLMGERTPLVTDGGLLVRRISSTPETLLFRQCRKLESLGSLLVGRAAGMLIPGRPCAVAVSLFNPFAHPVEFQLEFETEKEIAVRPTESTVRLAAGERKEIAAEVQLSGAAGARDSVLKLHAAWPGGATSIGIPLRPPIFIPAERKPDEWDFVLNRRDQVKMLFEADPGNLHRVWRGPDDLSARLRLSAVGNALNLEFEVIDDKHIQPYRGVRTWEGDGVQFAFSIPGQKGLWIAGAALLADDAPEAWIWEAPEGFSTEKAVAAWKLSASRQGTLTRYALTIPLDSIGLAPALLKQGIRFNALVNDNDGYGREGWIRIAEGIASNRSSERYPILVFED